MMYASMLTNDKKICSPAYWDKIYSGNNDNAKVDASNTKRPANSFDRFGWVAQYAEGPYILGVASGHAHIEKRIKAKHPDWDIWASDQSEEAQKVSKYTPYLIFDAYKIPFADKYFNTVIACQCLEYMEDIPKFLTEAKRVSYKLLITVPIGNMAKWSQLYEFTEESIRVLLQLFGTIEILERHEDLLLVKLKFND